MTQASERTPTAHEMMILGKLRELQFDPLELPAPPSGKPSVAKQATRAALKGQLTSAVFDKAWQRLRTSRQIKDA